MTAQPRTWAPLWPLIEQRIIEAQPNGRLPKPNAEGWIGPIRSPLRKEERPSFSVKPDSDTQPGGFEDHGTGEGGPLSKLAHLMNIDPRISATTRSTPVAVTLEAFCNQRKLDQVRLVEQWNVRETQWKGRPALRYSTTLGIDRIKYLDKGKGLDKYIWAAQGGRRHWYGLQEALALGGPIYLVNGEPSVWACQQQGVAAVCLCGGEGAAPTAELVAELNAAGVTEVGVVYDRDDKGRAGAPKAVAALQEGSIAATAYELPEHLGEHGDVDDLQRWEGASLGNALAALPKLADSTESKLTDPAVRPRRYLTEDEIDTLRPPTWLIKGVIPAGEVTLISGPGDAGKTFIATDMMKRVAQHYPVMYAALEDAPGIRIRKRAWEIHHQMPKNGNFYMWTQTLDLFDPASIDSFIAEVKPLGLRMITFDTLSRGLGGADENSNTDMAIVMNHCERIAHETGAAVDVLHHTTKDGQAYRGASALKNNTYGHIEISRDDDLIHFKIGRIKNTPEQPTRYFKLVTVPLPDIIDDEGTPMSSAVILPADRVISGDTLTRNQIKMLESLLLMTDAQGGAATTELEKATGLVGNSFYSALKRLRNLGLVDKGEKRTDPLYITLTGRTRLARESSNPEHQETNGQTIGAVPPFEVNAHLGELLPLLPGSNDGSDESGSNPGEGASYQVPTILSGVPDAVATTATKLLPESNGSNGLLTTTSLSPLGEGVGSNRSSNGDRNESQIEHDRLRGAEIDRALSSGDIKAARKAAAFIRGRKAQKDADLRIDEYEAAHKADEVPV